MGTNLITSFSPLWCANTGAGIFYFLRRFLISLDIPGVAAVLANAHFLIGVLCFLRPL